MARRYCALPTRCRLRGKAGISSLWASSTILPQPADRGTRFAFAVEKILTPDAVRAVAPVAGLVQRLAA